MKVGKEQIHNLPLNPVTNLGAYAQQLQKAAEEQGIYLPPPVRLQIGEPSFRTPEHIRQAAIESIQQETLTYGPPAGWSWLRELIAAKLVRVNGYHVSPENIAVAVGGTGAIQAILLGTVGVGDEVLLPDPGWPHYRLQIANTGATAVPYPLDPDHDWLPDVERLKRLVTPRTRLIIINTPGNPTGAVFPPELVHELLAFARQHDLYLLSDECYDEMVFEGQHRSPANYLTPKEFENGNLLCVYTFSKTYAMTGWRVGYLVTSKELIKTIATVLDASTTNVSTLSQRAAAAALTGPQDCVHEMRAIYQRRRDLAVTLLTEAGRYLYTPHGAFYLLIEVSGPNGPRAGRQFSQELLRETNIVVAPGSSFGEGTQGYIRVSLSASDEEIERGISEICAFANRQ